MELQTARSWFELYRNMSAAQLRETLTRRQESGQSAADILRQAFQAIQADTSTAADADLQRLVREVTTLVRPHGITLGTAVPGPEPDAPPDRPPTSGRGPGYDSPLAQQFRQLIQQRGAQMFTGTDPRDNVRDLQRVLRANGFDIGNYGQHGVDGLLGPRTRTALQQFHQSLAPNDPRRAAISSFLTEGGLRDGRGSWRHNNSAFANALTAGSDTNPLRTALTGPPRVAPDTVVAPPDRPERPEGPGEIVADGLDPGS